jgi:8-oxo-dGTP pyrophosphatase MutT (NUDIX family)
MISLMDSAPRVPAAPRRPNARGQGELLRTEIVSCAVRMLDELADDEALSLRAVARGLSISPTSVYLYFPDRDALVLAAMQRCHDDMLQIASAAEESVDTPASRLRARIRAQATWAQEHPGLYKVMHESKASRHPGMPFKEVMLARTAAAIQECMDAGTAPPADSLTVALDLRAAVIGMLSLRINEPNLPWPPLAEQVDRFLTKLVGLAPQTEPDEGARIVAALLRDGDRVLLCHRAPGRRWYPDVWDLPGGHVEPGELPGAALARELREELGIGIAAPSGPPLREVRTDTLVMRIWLVEEWTGSPVNAAPEEHDAIGWFAADALGELRLAHDGYLALFSKVLADQRA